MFTRITFKEIQAHFVNVYRMQIKKKKKKQWQYQPPGRSAINIFAHRLRVLARDIHFYTISFFHPHKWYFCAFIQVLLQLF